jgi:hypothetical protein
LRVTSRGLGDVYNRQKPKPASTSSASKAVIRLFSAVVEKKPPSSPQRV